MCPAGALLARLIGIILTTRLKATTNGMRHMECIWRSPFPAGGRLRRTVLGHHTPDHWSFMKASSTPPSHSERVDTRSRGWHGRLLPPRHLADLLANTP